MLHAFLKHLGMDFFEGLYLIDILSVLVVQNADADTEKHEGSKHDPRSQRRPFLFDDICSCGRVFRDVPEGYSAFKGEARESSGPKAMGVRKKRVIRWVRGSVKRDETSPPGTEDLAHTQRAFGWLRCRCRPTIHTRDWPCLNHPQFEGPLEEEESL